MPKRSGILADHPFTAVTHSQMLQTQKRKPGFQRIDLTTIFANVTPQAFGAESFRYVGVVDP